MAGSRWVLTRRQYLELRAGGPLDHVPAGASTLPDGLLAVPALALPRLAAMKAFISTYGPELRMAFADRTAVVRDGIRHRVLLHYSHGTLRCATCGHNDLEALTLDHVENDGKAHRQIVHGNLSVWLWRHGLPKTPAIQVLCMNCNHIKAKHQKRRTRGTPRQRS